MAIAGKLITIGIVFVSFLVGGLSLFMMSNLPVKIKKRHIEVLISQLINFILFMWAGKVILNLSRFLSDPLSILAYPGNSAAFYFAVFGIIGILTYKAIKKNFELLSFMYSFVHVFLIASFFYEFLEIILRDSMYSFSYLLLLSILIALYFFLQNRMQKKILLLTILSGWSLGMLILDLIQPFVTVFGYILKPWFIGVFFATVLVLFNLLNKIKVRDK